MKEQWFAMRHRLLSRGLMPGAADSLSLRVPGSGQMWWGLAGDGEPLCVRMEAASVGADMDQPLVREAVVHQAVYEARDDVCAVLWGGAAFGRLLPGFGGTMPAVFDEQVRQLGLVGASGDDLPGLRRALASGGNAAVFQNQVLLLGMTPSRLALNAELFEKCAKAYVCAVGAGGKPRTLPWIVRWVANGRLVKEQTAAQAMVRAGTMPVETRGY